MHWGDGSSDTYSIERRQDAHLRRRRRTTTRSPSTWSTRTARFLDRANPHSVHVDNVAPTIAISGAANVNEGSLVQPDPGRGHRSGHGHRHQLRSSTGATATATPTRSGGVKTHTYADGPNRLRRHRRPGRRGRHFLDRANALRCTSTTSRRRSRSAAPRTSTRARSYSLTLGAVTDPGSDTVTSYDRPLGRRQHRHLRHAAASRRTPTPTGRTTTTITVDLIDEDGTFLDRANALSVHVNNVKPEPTIDSLAGAAERHASLETP